MKDIKAFLKKGKKLFSRERYKNLSWNKKKSWFSKEKEIIKWEKTPYYNYKKLFSFRIFDFFLGLGQVSLLEIRNFFW